MFFRAVIVIGLCLSLAACASRLNPFNWFGSAEREEITIDATPDAPQETDARPLVAEVIDLSVQSLPSGAIITATGLPPRQGFWEAELVEASREDGRIIYDFRVFPPPGATQTGNRASREVITASELSNQELAGLREIVVRGAQNQLVSRR